MVVVEDPSYLFLAFGLLKPSEGPQALQHWMHTIVVAGRYGTGHKVSLRLGFLSVILAATY